MQYCLGVQLNWKGNRVAEWDNLKNFDDPYHSQGPTICNMTLISSGKYSINNLNDQNYGAMYLFQLADSMKGDFRNIVALDGTQYAFWMRNHSLKAHAGQEPMGLADANGHVMLSFKGLVTWNTGCIDYLQGACGQGPATWYQLVTDDNGQAAATDSFLNNPSNKCFCDCDPQLRGVSREFNFAALDPRPCATSPVFSSSHWVQNPNDGFFDVSAHYVGAFDSVHLWCDGWTKLSQAGCLTKMMTTFPEMGVVPPGGNFDILYNLTDIVSNPIVGLHTYIDPAPAISNCPDCSGKVPTDLFQTFLQLGWIGAAGSVCDGSAGIVLKVSIPQTSTLIPILGQVFDNPAYPGSGSQLPRINYLGLYTLKTVVNFQNAPDQIGTTRLKISD
jgi:hypothetical protein